MIGGRFIHRQSIIPTVSMMRKQQKKRLEKLKKREDRTKDCDSDCRTCQIDHLSLHLMILRSSSITVDRSRVANRLSHCAQKLRESKKYHTATRHISKALNVIFDDLFGLMALERDEYVLEKLLELEPQMRFHLTWEILELRSTTDVFIPLKILEENWCLRVRYRALTIVANMQEGMHDIDTEISSRTTQIIVDLLAKFGAMNGRITGEPLSSSSKYWDKERFEEAEIILILEIIHDMISQLDYEDLTRVCCNEDLLRIIFEALNDESELEKREKEFNYSVPARVLGEILDWSLDEDREYLRGRYEEEIRMALMKMRFYRLYRVMCNDDIATLITSNPSMLNKLAIRMKKGLDCFDTDFENDNRYSVTIRLLRYGLTTTSSELQRILGLDLLCDCARYYAAFHFPGDNDEAQIFRDVLRAHPEWRESFRIATACANPISHTALLGQSIQPRRSNPALYIIIDEDLEMI